MGAVMGRVEGDEEGGRGAGWRAGRCGMKEDVTTHHTSHITHHTSHSTDTTLPAPPPLLQLTRPLNSASIVPCHAQSSAEMYRRLETQVWVLSCTGPWKYESVDCWGGVGVGSKAE